MHLIVDSIFKCLSPNVHCPGEFNENMIIFHVIAGTASTQCIAYPLLYPPLMSMLGVVIYNVALLGFSFEYNFVYIFSLSHAKRNCCTQTLRAETQNWKSLTLRTCDLCHGITLAMTYSDLPTSRQSTNVPMR